MRRLLSQIVLSMLFIGLFCFILDHLDYFRQFSCIDNLSGWMPVILLSGILFFLLLLVWKRANVPSTFRLALGLLIFLWAILFKLSVTGNWYPLGKIVAKGSSSPDLSLYAPFTENTKAAMLPAPASITLKNQLPRLDGATALYPVYAAFTQAAYEKEAFSPDDLRCSNTPQAYESLIKGDCDVIFVAGPSKTQMASAKEAGVDLVCTEIGREGFVFLVGQSNPISDLTHQQIQNIYSGKTAKWQTLGWPEGGNIIAFQRPEGSGSQTGLQKTMGHTPIQKPQPLPDNYLFGKGSMMQQIGVYWQGVQPAIGYSYRYYARTMYPNNDAKILSIDGVYPSDQTIADGSYPFVSSVYAVTNGAPKGNSKKLIDWILSSEGQYLVGKTGYVPVKAQ